MITIDKTDIFAKWLRKLKDRKAKAIIFNHIDNMEEGKTGGGDKAKQQDDINSAKILWRELK